MKPTKEYLGKIKEKTKALSTKVCDFVDCKKQLAHEKIDANSASVFLLKWTMTHWVTILLVIILSVFFIRNRLLQEDLREAELQKELQELNLDLDKMKKEREAFLARIKELETIKKTNIKETKKVRDNASKLDSEGKKRLLLEYKTRLLKKRGL